MWFKLHNNSYILSDIIRNYVKKEIGNKKYYI